MENITFGVPFFNVKSHKIYPFSSIAVQAPWWPQQLEKQTQMATALILYQSVCKRAEVHCSCPPPPPRPCTPPVHDTLRFRPAGTRRVTQHQAVEYLGIKHHDGHISLYSSCSGALYTQPLHHVGSLAHACRVQQAHWNPTHHHICANI